ncbi:alpha/beta hydrolase [Streptomyces sp. NPDC088745]|uniref:alpha/beta hydrolase n=1 Tax=Streptomyces sp. NPDC088745 TaxID=3365884 RepID=UPI00381CDB62
MGPRLKPKYLADVPTYRSKSLLLALSTAAAISPLIVPGAQAAPVRQAASAPQDASARQAAPTPQDALAWTPCPRPDLGGPATQECATLTVPVDHAVPAGPQLSLAVSRVRSEDPAKRRGALLVLAGGPGGSGVQRLTQRGTKLQARLGDAYDLVALDPRGTGGSTRATCRLPSADRHLTALRSWPAPGGNIDANIERSRRTAALCAENGGPVLRSLSTANQVRDMDLFRRALGERKLSAWGTSYGAYAAAVYAQKYPQHTDRWVLDSVADPDPAHLARTWMRNTGQAVEDAFPAFAAWAADPARETDGLAPRLAQHPALVRPLVLALAARLDRAPKESTTPGTRLTGNHLRQALQNALYGQANHPALARLIAAASSTDPEVRPVLTPDIAGPVPDADAATTIGVICNDVRWPEGRGTVAAHRRAVLADRARYPLTAGFPANITPCSFWKWAPADEPARITSSGPSNILVVQNRRDPSTPYFGALKMREALGDRARLVSVNTTGHGSYLGTGNACGDARVTAFLTGGVRPGSDVSC